MTPRTNFDSINFNPDTKELSIKSDGELILGPFDLSTIAVKLQVAESEEQLQTWVEASPVGSFPTEKFELKIKFTGDNHNAQLSFGTLAGDSMSHFDDNEIIAFKGKFHAFWIGADDIRNTFTTIPKGLLPMEQKIISFEIVNDFLILKYHSSINPN
jgi:hypothetical protein